MTESTLYIASTGRSGTTLLETLLGLHPQLWTLGEPEMLAWTGERPDLLCGCGRRIVECDFWQTVLEEMCASEIRQLGYFRGPSGAGKVIRGGLLRRELMGREEESDPEIDPAEVYGQVSRKLLQSVRTVAAELTGQTPSWTVDSSKHPYRLLWLLRARGIEVRMIHLVRDPRAFAYSVTGHGDGSIWDAFRAGARWTVQNAIHQQVAASKLSADQVYRLNYEDLALDPAQTMTELFSWLEVAEFDVVSRFRDDVTHGAVGNPMRWKETDIELDRRWEREGGTALKLASFVGSSPLAGSYGYRPLQGSHAESAGK